MFKAPRQLPLFSNIVDDLPAKPRAIAHHLDVTERAVYKWKAADQAPRAVQLALFWETRWGRDLASTTAMNGAMYHRAHVASLEREIARLQAILGRVESLSDTANSPVFRVS